jgi:hypothetical protein
VSGVWIRARKLEGELDVGRRRILCATGESMSHCGTSLVMNRDESKFDFPSIYHGYGWERIHHRGRVVSLLFDIVLSV